MARHRRRTARKLAFDAGCLPAFRPPRCPVVAAAALRCPRPSAAGSADLPGPGAEPRPRRPSRRRARQRRAPRARCSTHSPATARQANHRRILTPEQRALVDRVSAYLSSVQTLVGNFVQVGPDGSRTAGPILHLRSPARSASNTTTPSPIELIADGSPWSCATASSQRRISIRCRRRRCAFCLPIGSTCCATPMWSRSMPTTSSSPW